MEPKQDVYSKITDRIIADLERGVRTWMQPWKASNLAGRIARPLRANGVPYSGINTLVLWAEAIEKGYTAPTWMTFKQALELGACVRKGEKGSLVVYAGSVLKTEENKQGQDETRAIHFLKGYTVFNVQQVAGLPAQYYGEPAPVAYTVERNATVEAYFAATSISVRHGGDRAYYTSELDYVQMPPAECFRDMESYYATLAHESAHWTKHETRLDRTFGRKTWGDEGYAKEELVAELASAFLCSELGITPEIREDHASYIGNWLQVLKNDKRAIFTAASFAQKAVDYLNRYQVVSADVLDEVAA